MTDPSTDVAASSGSQTRTQVSVALTPGDDGRIAEFAYQGAGYRVTGDVSRGANGLVITRMEIEAPAPRGVTAPLLRRAPMTELLSAVREAVTREESMHGIPQHQWDEHPREERPQGKRVEMTDALLRDVALAYLEESSTGAGPGTVKRMAERFGRPEGTIRTWITRSRQGGWLGPGSRGRAGAEPGPRLQFEAVPGYKFGESLEDAKRKWPELIEHVEVPASDLDNE